MFSLLNVKQCFLEEPASGASGEICEVFPFKNTKTLKQSGSVKQNTKTMFNPLPVPEISKRVPSITGRSTKVCAASTSVCGRPAWTGRVARSTIRHGRRELAARLPRPFPVSKRPSHSPAAAEEVYATSLTPASRRLAPDAGSSAHRIPGARSLARRTRWSGYDSKRASCRSFAHQVASTSSLGQTWPVSAKNAG